MNDVSNTNCCCYCTWKNTDFPVGLGTNFWPTFLYFLGIMPFYKRSKQQKKNNFLTNVTLFKGQKGQKFFGSFFRKSRSLNTTSFERVGCTFHIKMQMAFVAKIAIFQVQSYVRIWSQLGPRVDKKDI